jgi:hypothetical protein
MKMCPKCGNENHCALENGENPIDCWCMKIIISKAIIIHIEKKYSNQPCLCKPCLEEEIIEYQKKDASISIG